MGKRAKVKVSELPRRLRRRQNFYPRPLRFRERGNVLKAFSEKNPGQRICGTLRPGNSVFIERVNAVVERQGFGTNLVKYFLAKCRRRGIKVVNVEAWDDQIPFWRKLGFVEMHKRSLLITVMVLKLGVK